MPEPDQNLSERAERIRPFLKPSQILILDRPAAKLNRVASLSAERRVTF